MPKTGLNKQLVPISFGPGIDTRGDDKQPIPGTFRFLKNSTFDKKFLFKKRPGYDLINLRNEANDVITNPKVLARFKDELNLLTNTNFYSYSPTRNKLIERGQVFNATASSTPVIADTNQHSSPDSIFVENFKVFTWIDVDNNTINYSVIDNDSESSIISNAVVVSAAYKPRLAFIQNYVYIFYVKDGLKYRRFNILDPSVLETAQTVTTNIINESPIFDLESTHNRIYIAFNEKPPTEQIRLMYLNVDGTPSGETSVVGANGRSFVDLTIDSNDRVVVFYGDETAVGYTIYSFQLTAAILVPTNVETISNSLHGTIAETSSGIYTAIYEINSTTDQNLNYVRSVEVEIDGSVGTPATLLKGVSLVSKAFLKNEEVYVLTLLPSALQGTYFLINSNGNIAAKIAAGNAGSILEAGALPAISEISDTELLTAATVKSKISSENGQVVAILGISSIIFTFNSNSPYSATQLGENLHMTGGILRMYDGQTVVEHGFHAYPENVVASPLGPNTIATTVDTKTDVKGELGADEVQLISFDTPPTSIINTEQGLALALSYVGYNSRDSQCGFTLADFASTTLMEDKFRKTYRYFSYGGGGFEGFSGRLPTVEDRYRLNPKYVRAVTVTGDTTVGFTVTFKRPKGPLPLMRVAKNLMRGAANSKVVCTVSRTTAGTTGIQERQTINFLSPPTAGTWTITIGAQTTAAIAFNASNANIKTAIENLSNITTVDVTGSYADGISVRFINPIIPDSLMSVASSLTHEDYGGTLEDGSYGYTAVYSWTDNFGQIHRSAPSPIVSVDLSSGTKNQGVKVQIPTLKLTDKTDVQIELYRTENNGTIFYSIVPAESPLLNDPTADTVTYIDGLADSELISREPLYTTGGILDNIAAPSCAVMAASSRRLAVAGIDGAPYTVRFSKLKSALKPVEFTDSIERDIDPVGGAITALAVLDEKWIIFTSRAMFAIAGQGPNNLGLQDDFTDPEQISTDIGCVEPRSIVVTPQGIMFMSSKGIYLLTRALTLENIGEPMKDYNNLNITSAKVLSLTNQVLFTTDSDTTITYSYDVNQWGTYSNHTAISAETIGSEYYFLKNSEELFKQNNDKFTDGSSPITQFVETGWINFTPLDGYQRVYKLLILGRYKSNHKLRVSFAYDYVDAFTQSVIVDSSDFINETPYGDDSPYGNSTYGGDKTPYNLRIDLKQQKCAAIKVRIEELQDTGGAGLELSAMVFQVGAKAGVAKLPDANKVGTS